MKLRAEFFERDAVLVAKELLGKYLFRKFPDGHLEKKIITEVEVYAGEEDLASHARFGKTARNKVMYGKGGIIYVYLIYGTFRMLNIVTGKKDDPQAILVRRVQGIKGPGLVGKWLKLDKTFYGEDLSNSPRIWLEDSAVKIKKISKTPRISVNYAKSWAKKKWRSTTDLLA